MSAATDTTPIYGLEIQVPYPQSAGSAILQPAATVVGSLNGFTVTPASPFMVPTPAVGGMQFQVRLTNVPTADPTGWTCEFYQVFSTQDLAIGYGDDSTQMTVMATPFECEPADHTPLLGKLDPPVAAQNPNDGTTDWVFPVIIMALDQNVPEYRYFHFKIRFMVILQQTTASAVYTYVVPGDPDIICENTGS